MTELAADPNQPRDEPPTEIVDSLNEIVERVYGNELVGYVAPLDQLRKLEQLERHLGQMPQHNVPVRHLCVPGGVAREMIAPSDTIMIGAIHRYATINVLSEGEVTMLGPQGMVRVKAPYSFVSPAGTKRAGYAHTRVVWTTFVPVDAGDVITPEAVFDRIAFRSVDDYFASLPPLEEEQLQIEGPES